LLTLLDKRDNQEDKIEADLDKMMIKNKYKIEKVK
jgi:hypothetical protein